MIKLLFLPLKGDNREGSGEGRMGPPSGGPGRGGEGIGVQFKNTNATKTKAGGGGGGGWGGARAVVGREGVGQAFDSRLQRLLALPWFRTASLNLLRKLTLTWRVWKGRRASLHQMRRCISKPSGGVGRTGVPPPDMGRRPAP